MRRDALHALLCHVRQLAALPATDAELLRRYIASRDVDAFEQLLVRHGPMVLGVCRRVLRDAHAVEDVFQETFLLLADRATAIRQPSSLAAWLHGVARRLAARGRTAGEPLPTDVAAQTDRSAEPGWRETLALLDEELLGLPDHLRFPLVLCYLQGRTRDEAARQLGWSVGTLRRRLDRGRAVLRARLTRRGVSLPAGLAGVLLTETTVSPALSAATIAAVRLGTAPAAARLCEGGLYTVLKNSVTKTLLLAACGVGSLAMAVWAYRASRLTEMPPAPDPPAIAAPAAPDAVAAAVREAAEAVEECVETAWFLKLGLAELHARQGEDAAALKCLNSVAHGVGSRGPYVRAMWMVLIAYRQARAGDTDSANALLAEAHRVANTIAQEGGRSDFLRLAATCRADCFGAAPALDEAMAMPSGSERSQALTGVAVRFAKDGDAAGVLRAAEAMRPLVRLFTRDDWQTVSTALLKGGERSSAEELETELLNWAEQCRKESVGNWSATIADTLSRYAIAQHATGDTAGAQKTIRRLIAVLAEVPLQSKNRLYVLAELARAQAECGEPKTAHETMQQFVEAAAAFEDHQMGFALLLPAQKALGDWQAIEESIRRTPDIRLDFEIFRSMAERGRYDEARALAHSRQTPLARARGLVAAAHGLLDRVPPEHRPRQPGTFAVAVPEREPDPPTPARLPADSEEAFFRIQNEFDAMFQKYFAERDRKPAGAEGDKPPPEPAIEPYAERMLEVARKYRGQSGAYRALEWIAEHGFRTPALEPAVVLLREDYLTSKAIGRPCHCAGEMAPHVAEVERLIRAVLAKTSHSRVRGHAICALAIYLKKRSALAHLAQTTVDVDKIRLLIEQYGEANYLALRAGDPEGMFKEAVALFEKVLAEYADLEPFGSANLGVTAREALAKMRAAPRQGQ